MPYFSYPKILIFNIWGLCLGLAFIAGLIYLLRQKKADPIDVLNLTFLGFLGAIAGAAFFHFLLFGSWGGFVFYGGLGGGLLAGWFYVFYRKLDFCFLADLAAPAIALGIFIGRIGCFLINDHLGIATNLPWGIFWPDGVIRHPVALYLSLNGLVLFFLLRLIKKNHFLFFLTYYAVSRFLLDFLRVERRWQGLTAGQLTSLGILVILTGSYLKIKYQKKN